MSEAPTYLPEATALPVLETARLRLRPVRAADVDALFAVFASPRVMRYWSTPPMRERAEAEQYVRDIEDCFRERSLFQWGLARRDVDALIGTCTLAALNATHRRAELGYALHHAHWGSGLMHEALTRLLDFAFGDLAMHRMEADVDPRNAASIRSLARLGFRREGHLRERWLVGDEIQDGLYYGLLASEWKART